MTDFQKCLSVEHWLSLRYDVMYIVSITQSLKRIILFDSFVFFDFFDSFDFFDDGLQAVPQLTSDLQPQHIW